MWKNHLFSRNDVDSLVLCRPALLAGDCRVGTSYALWKTWQIRLVCCILRGSLISMSCCCVFHRSRPFARKPSRGDRGQQAARTPRKTLRYRATTAPRAGERQLGFRASLADNARQHRRRRVPLSGAGRRRPGVQRAGEERFGAHALSQKQILSTAEMLRCVWSDCFPCWISLTRWRVGAHLATLYGGDDQAGIA